MNLAAFPMEVMPMVQFIVGLIVGVGLTLLAIAIWAVFDEEGGGRK